MAVAVLEGFISTATSYLGRARRTSWPCVAHPYRRRCKQWLERRRGGRPGILRLSHQVLYPEALLSLDTLNLKLPIEQFLVGCIAKIVIRSMRRR